MRIYRAKAGGVVVEREGRYDLAERCSWDALFVRDDAARAAEEALRAARPIEALPELGAPIGSQEVWAAGVTYYRSRTARMEESKAAGGGDFYDRVYVAERPELFFKASPHRVVGLRGAVAIRKDSSWSVPEPELTVAVAPSGKIIGYTIGNDMSARDIEGENPLYLPQAKVYDGSCALGPGIWLTEEPLSAATEIRMEILRDDNRPFSGSTTLAEMKRDPRTLVEYLFRQSTFPSGCYLMTGTGIVPPDSFALQQGDEIRITIEPIGTLINFVA